MKWITFFFAGIFFASLLTSCGVSKDSAKYEFKTGFYKSSLFDHRKTMVFVMVSDDSIIVHPLKESKGSLEVDTSLALSYSFPNAKKDRLLKPYHFKQNSFDFDILTIPFKYRPVISGFPNQLNTNFNGAFFLGYRTDDYKLSYKRNPLKTYDRKLNHKGYSLGVFAGLGSTAINPWVTNNYVVSEYDGAVFLSGVAGMVGLNDLSFGVGIGVDHLIGTDHEVWIYQGKPWFGLVLGLNLN